LKNKYSAIYAPTGRAAEYSELAVNLYDGCRCCCKYCYVPQILHITPTQFHARDDQRIGIREKIKKDLIAMKAAGDKRRVLLCFTCDPYPSQEMSLATRWAIEQFAEYEQPFQVLTKKGMYAADDFELYKPGDAYAATLALYDSSLSRQWEPGAADPSMRMRSLQEAKKRGIETWASLEPVIIPEQTFRLYEETKEYVDRYAIGKLNYMAPPEPIDWRIFALRMIERCERDNKDYYIKDSLKKYIQEESI
jgi:DNA repair photolyase